MNKKMQYVSFLSLLAFLLFAPKSVDAQVLATPTLYCLGSCPTETIAPTNTIVPSSTTIPIETIQPTTEMTPIASESVTATIDPCAGINANVSVTRHNGKHKNYNGLFQFLLMLLSRLFQLLGINFPVPQPSITPTPTITSSITPSNTTITPTVNCLTPTVTSSLTSTIGPTVALTVTPTSATSQIMKLISRNVPADASSGTASQGNDTDYNAGWNATASSAWLAYDLSQVPVAERKKVLLVWYNDDTWEYDPTLISETTTNNPDTYTIETNTAAGGVVPTTGWTSKVSITSNKYHSRQHVLDMTGANWIRINISKIQGGSSTNLNMDVYDISANVDDDWIIYGSSSPAEAMRHETINNVVSFSELINKVKSDHFPVQENGAISGLTTTDGVAHIDEWLSIFPGKYVGIALGANDADSCFAPTTTYNNLVQMIDKITAAGKVPVLSKFNWSKTTNVQNCGSAIIAKIDQIYSEHAEVIKGPDLWTYFKAHPELVSSDNLHPTTAGFAIYRQMWADSALQTVYK
jgi:lysophospholipase L1-like esterase